ncbi:multidrug effflux MFS transporter [Geodermatophilus sabuli]|uniref:Multidrug effflux MFS transporter n=1 Tax=Geodermatophilus sabuli TaxID=1564158 RepID=A0A7K3W7T0_9ACTN|nr:multidrug effflux MFS transporter [Geodermatophilus sabuli]NEK59917.1 multidrug effflux MFS transporter [Geodermatophilus sabuli]
MAEPRTPRSIYLVLGSLIALGPLASELYIPALPDMAAVLATSPSLAQATVATCLVGLALGQLVAGPLSDRLGRRRPLLAGVALFALASGLCALSTSIWVLLALRFVQGLAGGAAVVIARAVVRDLYEGRRAARVFSRLMLVFGLAPIVAPLAGAQILRFTDWRGPFVALVVIGGLILVGARAALPETLPPAARHTDGSGAQLRQLGRLLADRPFLGHVAISGLHGATLFSYVTMSAFVLQEEHGLSVQAFSAVLAVNAVGLVLGAQLNGFLVMRLGPGRLLIAAVAGIVLASTAVVAGALTGSLVALLVPLFLATRAWAASGPTTWRWPWRRTRRRPAPRPRCSG